MFAMSSPSNVSRQHEFRSSTVWLPNSGSLFYFSGGCPDVGKTANLTQPGEQSNRAQKDNQTAMSQLLDEGKPPRKRSGRRKRKPPSYRDCPPETGSSRGQGRKSTDRSSKKETPIQSGRRASTLVSYCGLERKHPLSRDDTPKLTTPAKSCGNGAPHSGNIDDKTNHSRSKRDSLTPDKDAHDRRFVSNPEDLSHEKIGNECRPHLQLSSRQGRIFKMSIEGLLEQSPSPPPGSSDRRSRTSSCSEELFDFSSSRSRTGTKAELHDDGNLLSSSREHQSSSSQENIKSANKGTRPHEDVSKASPTVESLEEKLGKLNLTETAERREPEKDNIEVVEGEADSRTELLPRQTQTNTSSRKSIPSKGFIHSRSITGLEKTDTASQSHSYEKPTSATKTHKAGTSSKKSSSQTEISLSYSTKNTPVKEPCDKAKPWPARLSEKTSQQERRTTLKSCSNETYVHNDTHTYSASRWAYLNKSTAQVKNIPPSNSNKSHANKGSDSSVNKTSRTDFKKHASFKEVHCQKTSSDKSSNDGKSACVKDHLRPCENTSSQMSIDSADKHAAQTVNSGPGKRKVRPGETNVRQGEAEVPGATKVRPAESMMRPAETKVRPVETKVRPGDTKVRPGDMKVRPREPKLQQGETKVRPGETKGRPGETKGRPGETKGRPGETKGRPGETKVQPGNIKVRPRDARVQHGVGTSSNKNKETSNTVMNVMNKNGKLQGTEGSGPTRSQAVKGRQASGDSSNSQRRAGGRKSRSRRSKGKSRSRNEGRQKTPLEEEQLVGVTTTIVNTEKRDFVLATEKTGTDERTTQPLVKGVQRASVGKSSRTPQVQQTSATMEKPAENTALFRDGGLALCEEKTLVSSQCPNKPATGKPRGCVQGQVQGTTQGQVHMISNNVSSENCIPCSEDWGSPPRINTSCPGPKDNSTSYESKEEDGVTHFRNLIDSDPMSNREPSSESDINCKEPFSNLSASAVSVNAGFDISNDKHNNELLLETGPSPSKQGEEEACKTKHLPRRLSTPRTSPNPPSPSPCCPHQPNCSHSGQRSHRVFSPPARRKGRQNGLAVGPGDVTSLRDSSHEAEMQDPGYTLQDSTKRESVPQRERRQSTPHTRKSSCEFIILCFKVTDQFDIYHVPEKRFSLNVTAQNY